MRGKVLLGTLYRLPVRITPAHAGKSASRCSFGIDSRDHPRTCGEKARAYCKIYNEWGSPPHMRGKGEIESYADECDRITPAHAGKRYRKIQFAGISWDHPRTCGEKDVKNEQE